MNAALLLRPLIAAILLGGAALVPLEFVAQNANPIPFSAYGEGDDQLGRLRESLQGAGYEWSALVTGPLQLRHVEDPARTVYLAVGVERSYTQDELDALQQFSEEGGHLFVADTGPGANPLLGRFGLVVANRTLQDEVAGSRDWVTAHTQVTGPSVELRLGAPSALVPAPGTTHQVLGASTASSFLDLDDDGRATSADLMGPFPVLVLVRTLQGGTHLFASDTSLFADRAPSDGVARGELWVGLLQHLLPNGGHVLVDEARHPYAPSEQRGYSLLAALQSLGQDPRFPIAAILVAAGGAFWALSRRRDASWGPHRADPRWLPWNAPDADRAYMRKKLALLLLARRASLAPTELATFHKDQLAGMVPHDTALQAALSGTANETQWKQLESRLENHSTEN